MNKMNSEDRKKLEQIALDRLHATADDQWSYAWGGDGAVVLSYCPWSFHEEFDGTTEGLAGVWSAERLALIDRGDAEPNDNELRQWQQIRCRSTADLGEGYTVWIVPVIGDDEVEGRAVFMWDYGNAPEDPPWLKGVFESIAEAKAYLAAEGVISDVNPRG
jgi:hypothetical protein